MNGKVLAPQFEEERLGTIERIAAASPDADLVLQEIVDEVRSLFGARLCLINIVLRDTTFSRAWSAELPVAIGDSRNIPRAGSLCTRVVDNRNCLYLPDFERADGQIEKALLSRFGFRGYVGTPLVTSDGHAIGSLCLLNSEPLNLTRRDFALLEAQARAAVSRLELLGSLRQTRAANGWMRRSAQDMFAVMTPGGRLVEANQAVARAAGCTPEELVGRFLQELVHTEDLPVVMELTESLLGNPVLGDSFVHRLVRRNGEVVWVEWYPTCARQDGLLYLCGRDVTRRRRAEAALWKAANYDALTGMPNRSYFTQHLEGVIARRTACNEAVAVLFVDLDDFKLINDSIGHEVGDRLLQETAERLAACAGSRECVCRLGGDEFLILVDGVQVPDEPEAVARKVLAAMHRPFLLDDREVYIQASIGVAITSEPLPAGELLRQADVAMYSAKQIGKGTCQIFAPDMMSSVVERLALSTELRRAEEQKEFTLVYQPVVSLQTGLTEGAEALIRWRSPNRGEISPADFIPLAERTGLILPIGEWVLRQACFQAKEWLTRYERPIWVSVNLSPRQFLDANLVAKVQAALTESGLPPYLLKLELTETALIQDVAAAAATLRQLKQLGIRIGIDDFGTGYSSLSYLQQFPVDFLKIDRSFIWKMEMNPTGQKLVHAIIMLARALGLHVVAEGVETAVQADLLRHVTCDWGQGYFFERPISAEQFAVRHLAGA